MYEQDANAAPRPLKIARGPAPRIHLIGKIKPPAPRFAPDAGKTFGFAAEAGPETAVAPPAPHSADFAPTASEAPELSAEDEAALGALSDALEEVLPQLLASQKQMSVTLQEMIAETRESRMAFAKER